MSEIRTLRHVSKIERFFACIVKPIFLGGIYGFFNWITWKFYKTGFQKDYNHSVMLEAFDKAFDKNHWRKASLSRIVMRKGLDAILMFCNMDNAYNVRLMAFLDEYIKLSVKYGLRNNRKYKRCK